MGFNRNVKSFLSGWRGLMPHRVGGVFPVVGVAGLYLGVGVVPDSWKTGFTYGWLVSLLVEVWTLVVRKNSPLGVSLASGLILRLFILLFGTFLGKWTGQFSVPAFLFAFLAGFVVLEPLVLWQLSRTSSRSESASPDS